jgi:hypothetical protein
LSSKVSSDWDSTSGYIGFDHPPSICFLTIALFTAIADLTVCVLEAIAIPTFTAKGIVSAFFEL